MGRSYPRIQITAIVGPAVAFFLVLTSLPGIIGGVGLLKWKAWARILVIILAILDLFNTQVYGAPIKK